VSEVVDAATQQTGLAGLAMLNLPGLAGTELLPLINLTNLDSLAVGSRIYISCIIYTLVAP
jgi:hypothetical protein